MACLYEQARFWLSAPTLAHAPADEGREVAFAGRSNAGKSSAINVITRQKALARISKTPGRTQQLNFFRLDSMRRLVDLPGYGFAKVSASMRRQWQKTMEDYLLRRSSLRGVFLVMDIRHPLSEYDRQLIALCGQLQRPVHVALTKADKLKRGAAQTALLQVKRALREGGLVVSVQLFSALKRTGIEEAQRHLDVWLAGEE